MQFGFSAPIRGQLANTADLKIIAERAESLGYALLSVSDHLVVPRQIKPEYPYSDTGEFAWTADGSADCMEQFTLLGWLAAVTSTIRLLTSVIVIPHRNPLFMAKSIATTDQLSGGRVTLGCGAGWMREEFEALNIPDFDARGRVTNEYIEVMKTLWSESIASYSGEFIQFDGVAAEPKPVQNPHPPFWIGGESLAALRRAAAIGDAWYPFGSNPKFRMDTIESYVARRDKLFSLAEANGRDPASIDLAYNCAFHSETEQRRADGERLLFTGTPEQRAEDIRALAGTGVSTMMVNVTSTDRSEMLDRMEAFSRDVMPLVQ
ncbi:MAG: LLM class F420-dependent oxidoreductase [Gammaproteobacteria bacterium]|nr:LLM class F420-dependent oxidoreductase [Gammaproteobacteria bacterium]